MSFSNNPIQTNSFVQQSKADFDPSKKQIVIYQGRKFDPSITTLQQLTPKFSFTDQMFFRLGQILEVNASQISDFIPQYVIETVRNLEYEIFQATEQPVNQTQYVVKFSQKPLTVQDEIAQEEKNEKNQLLISDQIQHLMRNLGVQRQQQFLLASVSSSKELEKKRVKIAEYRALAEECYLQDPSHIEIRKKIDRNMILSYKGTLNQKDEKIIEKYWDYVAVSSEGRIKQAQILARLQELFARSLCKKMSSMKKQQKT